MPDISDSRILKCAADSPLFLPLRCVDSLTKTGCFLFPTYSFSQIPPYKMPMISIATTVTNQGHIWRIFL
ncbi:hypothetical protein A0U91_17100 (plasmid) [Acetobacter persici]|uniref:Uncharacterized protein n=1 Tax=Acetobacter persici TaxID=1076596 RepID=A0A1U9LKA6_9PROT|nr:hypothetical protein A0U91_17100 [Acetobacter persici]